ncbi:MAG: hypothetical protein ACTSQU_14560 [Promethearchaeota archaeon]
MEFPQKCIKCKASHLQLIDFQYVKIEKKKERMVTIPVCEFCKKDIIGYKKYENYYDEHKNRCIFSCIPIIIAGFFLSIFLPFFMFLQNTFFIYIAIFFLVSILSIFISGIKIIMKFIHPHRINKFMKLDKNGRLIIKDPEYRAEFEKLNESKTEIQLDLNIICPSCGAKYSKFIDFCNSCGKDMRIVFRNE